jgi:hypothetical protein
MLVFKARKYALTANYYANFASKHIHLAIFYLNITPKGIDKSGEFCNY